MKLMRFISFGLIIIGVTFHSCDQARESESASYQNEVEKLTTNDEKRSFLESILALDQEVRNSSAEAKLIAEFGYNSDEHMDFIKEQWRQDEINQLKVEAYLKKFGYPKKNELGKDAAIVPWLVIHHSTDNGARISHFSILYRAYLTEDIDDIALSMYLERTYKSIYRENIAMEDPYTTDEKISALIAKLGLQEEKEIAKKRIGKNKNEG